jgi:glycerol uptake facilitator-like aquaporin
MASKDKPPNNDQQQEDENYQDYSEYSLFTQCISELMGTFVLVMIGCGAECVSLYVDESSSNAVWQVPLLGFVGATLGIYSAASISSGHLNPAVTLSFAVVRPGLFPFRKVIPYWIAQVCGAILAGMTNFLLFYHAIEKYEEKYLSSSSSTKKKGGGRSGKKSTESECTEYDRNYLKSASAFGNFWR